MTFRTTYKMETAIDESLNTTAVILKRRHKNAARFANRPGMGTQAKPSAKLQPKR